VALTGTEASRTAFPAFKKPESKKRRKTLTWMAALLATMFIGTSIMAYLYQVSRINETVIRSLQSHVSPVPWVGSIT